MAKSKSTEIPVVQTAFTAQAKSKNAVPEANGKSKAFPSRPQHRILKALADANGPLNRRDISAQCFGGNSINLRALLDPLADAKMVKIARIGGKGEEVNETVVSITAKGRKAAEKPLAPSLRTSAGGATISHSSLPPVGGTFAKVYKGKEVVVQVVEGGFKVGKTTYTSLTAAAKAVRGTDQEVNGWAFFGLTKKVKATE